eukprot:TRINITY_DN3030_c0_g1_i1.p1 TRINITY_DN3030_c0_g1~~TRINITY_DN3030_c0_g1_i1.p1  ORF type:complete len:590 (+),score=165.38 TRINITY_DN3030_c0_g1_i1:25-1794(+)
MSGPDLLGPILPFEPFQWRLPKHKTQKFLKEEFNSIDSNPWPSNWDSDTNDSKLVEMLKKYFSGIESEDWKVPSQSIQKLMKTLSCYERISLLLLKDLKTMDSLISVIQSPSSCSNEKMNFCLELIVKLTGVASYNVEVFNLIEEHHLIPKVLKLIKVQSKIAESEGEVNEDIVRGLFSALGNLTEAGRKIRKEDSVRMFQKVPMLLKLSVHMLMRYKKWKEYTVNVVLDFVLFMDQFMQNTWKEFSNLFTDPVLIGHLAFMAEKVKPNKKAQMSAVELMGEIARMHYHLVLPHFQVILGILRKETKELAGVIMRALKVFAFLASNASYEEKKEMLNNGGLIVTRFQNSSDPAIESDSTMAISAFFEHKDLFIKLCTHDQMMLNNMLASFIETSTDEAQARDNANEYIIKHQLVCFLRACADNESLCLFMIKVGVVKANLEMLISRKISNHTIINCLGFHTALCTQIPEQLANYLNTAKMKALRHEFDEKMMNEYLEDPDSRVSHMAQECIRIEGVRKIFGPQAAKKIKFQMQLQRREHEQARGVFKCDGCEKLNPAKKCSRCKVASYCSRECQVKEWPTHKKVCKPST